ncbi:MAG: hypothetical protein U0350_48635 [Caldilineaceae bacterium]
MRLLRLIGLVATIAAVYFAQSIFDHQNLSQLIPIWLLDAYPPLYGFTRWLPADLFELAIWILAVAALGFGLLTPAWRTWTGDGGNAPSATVHRLEPRRFVWFAGLICTLLAILSGGVNLAYLWRTGSDSRLVQVAWAGALLLYLLGNIPIRSRLPIPAWQVQPRTLDPEIPSGHQGLFLTLLLLAVAVVLSWPLLGAPLAIDERTAEIGLRALAIARGTDARLFAALPNLIPQFAVVPTAITMRLSGDPLLGLRLTGLLTSLFTIWATWLLGHELFRRSPLLGYFGETLEDQGQWPALLAAALVATNYVFIQFSHAPIYLEPVGWGCISNWALLRAMRTGDRLTYALSGVVTGVAVLLYPSGFTFLLLAPLWWLGVWLLRRVQPKTRRKNSAYSAIGWHRFFTWVGGVFVGIAPMLGLWVRTPTLFWSDFRAPFLKNLWPLFSMLTFRANANGVNDYSGHLLASLVAPLFLLAISALLFNLDRWPGLLLFLWLASGLFVSSLLPQDTPAWANLLPILPALGLAIAFTVDRIRITLVAAAGTWALRTTTYLAVGLVLWVGFATWVSDYQFSRLNGNAASYTGYAIRKLDADVTPVLLLGQQSADIHWQTPIIDFLASNSANAQQHLTLNPEQWSPNLPPHSRIIIQPEDQGLIDAVTSHYPSGRLTTQRDLYSNPTLYLYALP